MPIYCYELKSNGVTQVIERWSDTAKPPSSIIVNGKSAKRTLKGQSLSVPATSGWPITCYASGVNAEDAGELRDHLAQKGVPTEVTPDGDPVYTDAVHQRKALKARGFRNKTDYN